MKGAVFLLLFCLHHSSNRHFLGRGKKLPEGINNLQMESSGGKNFWFLRSQASACSPCRNPWNPVQNPAVFPFYRWGD